MLTHPRSCGRALQGVDVRLVREDGSDAPSREPGEVVVRAGEPGTYTVAAGYLGAAGVEPFTDADGWFHTGDVATVDEDGFYVIVDRKKDMILSGGMNIASKEVEEIVASHDGVLEVAVTGEPDPRFGERVVAWVVRRDGSMSAEAEIVAYVASQAASYKKPSVVRFVESLPRSPTGKVQKRALRVDSAQVPDDPRRSRMNVADLVAIDIHTHAKIPMSGKEDPLTRAQRLEASKMFKTDIDTAVSVEDVAAYYRERKMAAVVFGSTARRGTGVADLRTRRSPRSPPRTPTC